MKSNSFSRRSLVWIVGVLAALFVTFGCTRPAHAIPSFARKYQTACTTCHTVFPVLNAFGEAFRRNGFRFPSKGGSLDSDAIKAELLPLGQDEYKKMFPNAVWPDHINQDVPLSLVANAGAAVNLPNSGARDAAGNTFAWNDFVGEIAIFAAGQFNDSLTYFAALSVEGDGIGIERAYLLWNDIAGPPHAFNLSVGRILPTLHSFGPHGSYLADLYLPSVLTGQLYNPTAPGDPLAMAYGHPDGVELNGIVGHRVDYSLGWVASSVADGLQIPNSQDAYAHVGFKLGGMSLDGEGPSGSEVVDPRHPWAETAMTLDVFGYHGLSRLDSGVIVNGGAAVPAPIGLDNQVNVIGGSARIQLESFTLTTGGYVERHSRPYTTSTPGDPAAVPPVDGVPDRTKATALVQFNELSYVIYPWLVPALRTEFTRINIKSDGYPGSSGNVLRIVPGVAMLIRPNVKFTLAAEIDRAVGAPPTGAWDPTGSSIAAQEPGKSKLSAERVLANLSFGF